MNPIYKLIVFNRRGGLTTALLNKSGLFPKYTTKNPL